MGKKMKNAPVYYALAQVRFNTVALLDQYVPTIQDRLRKEGFPDFEKAVVATINMNLGAGQGQVFPALQSQPRYQFLNEDKTSGFVLDQSSISFQTTNYDIFPPFSAALLRGLEILNEAVQLSYSDRLGLRYLDAVCPREGETLSQYLAPSMLGLFEHIGDRTLAHSATETKTQNGKIFLLGRATIFNQPSGGAAFPAEMQPVFLELAEKFREIKGTYSVIDTDSWIEGREKFDLGTLGKNLVSLQGEVRFSFDRMVTPHATKVWE
jgi:uncharacterized protein (TIGR04255 family)